MLVVIAGLPGSCNNLLAELVRRLAAGAGRADVRALVWHGGPGKRDTSLRDRANRVLVPVRHPGCRRKSALPRVKRDEYPEDECLESVCALIASGVPGRLVSVEALRDDPEGVGRDLAAWLGLPWVPWPAEVNPEHPQGGAVYDPNAKYLAGEKKL